MVAALIALFEMTAHDGGPASRDVVDHTALRYRE